MRFKFETWFAKDDILVAKTNNILFMEYLTLKLLSMVKPAFHVGMLELRKQCNLVNFYTEYYHLML